MYSSPPVSPVDSTQVHLYLPDGRVRQLDHDRRLIMTGDYRPDIRTTSLRGLPRTESGSKHRLADAWGRGIEHSEGANTPEKHHEQVPSVNCRASGDIYRWDGSGLGSAKHAYSDETCDQVVQIEA
jgi:hypothetical protein